ncbi:MAG: FMN-binding protein [Spirochaetales bacterium]|nr:FMN-binding protein [Spirochaetales bacterium]
MNTQGKIYTVVFMFLISLVFVFALSLVNSALAGQVERNGRISQARAILNAMGFSYTGDAEALTLFNSQVAPFTPPAGTAAGGDVYYRAQKNGQPIYAAISSGPGLWGTIRFAVAVNSDVTETLGIDIISQNETPGLGGRIDEAWFKAQFKGEALNSAGRITVGPAGTGDANLSNGRFDAITGASLTSHLFDVMLNTALARLRTILTGAPAGSGVPAGGNDSGGRQ